MKRDREGEARHRQEREIRERAARERAQKEQAEQEARAREKERLDSLSPVEREIEGVVRDRRDLNQSETVAVMQAVRGGRWQGDAKIEVAKWLRDKMESDGRWKEASAKRRPDRDKDYQNTLLVKRWLEGE